MDDKRDRNEHDWATIVRLSLQVISTIATVTGVVLAHPELFT